MADKFYDNYPDEPTELQIVEKYEVDRYYRIIKEAIYGEERAYQSIKSTRSIFQCKEYLSKYPYGKYRVEVNEIMLKKKEDVAWQAAKRFNSVSSYTSYI